MLDRTKEIIRDLWIPALRSGEYLQGHGELARRLPADNETRYCCLGVLCEILPDVKVESPDTSTIVSFDYMGDMAQTILPAQLAKDLDLDQCLVFTPFIEGQGSLVGLNDGPRWTFEQIADFLENEILNEDSTYTLAGYYDDITGDFEEDFEEDFE